MGRMRLRRACRAKVDKKEKTDGNGAMAAVDMWKVRLPTQSCKRGKNQGNTLRQLPLRLQRIRTRNNDRENRSKQKTRMMQ